MMRNALWTDSSNQSCWFYHQFLMATLTDKSGHTEIVPNFTIGDRIAYLDAQLVELRDMLDGDEKCKWIYNALYEYTLAISRMQERQLSVDEIKDLKAWLTMLRKLDPLRSGRWDAVEKSELFEIAPVL
jgi:geranylgeranyl transferase type-2 subunit alpha